MSAAAWSDPELTAEERERLRLANCGMRIGPGSYARRDWQERRGLTPAVSAKDWFRRMHAIVEEAAR